MKLLASRTAQKPLLAQFIGLFSNWVTDSVDTGSKTFGSTVAASTDPNQAGLTGPVANTIVFDCVALPPGAVITGGDLIVETAYVGPTAATIAIGTAAAPAALLAATSLLAVSRTSFLTTSPLISQDGSNVRITLNYTVANATAGKFRIRVQYTIDGRAEEVQVS